MHRIYAHTPAVGTSMYPDTTPAIDISRSSLKRLAMWILDDLDLLIAREGPDVLRPDDVLNLHEAFIALCQSHVTVLDLRATGIHRAVQSITGVATRWPGRLCDDCDKIVSTWTARFGPLNYIRPFLYGRGGRLEGIASATEYSQEALVRRWKESCPEQVHHNRSHQLGDLGFQPGAWWINPLFAYHAGIIGIESVEGGITFDKHGAYALVLTGTGEMESASEDHFTYRCPKADKGKYRITSATPQSRDPIRVLRSHNVNSTWGPTAGVRYEGLFSITGWSIRTVKSKDTASAEWKERDILFDVTLKRSHHATMEEVSKHPTAAEVDDYMEYKRLRRVHREAMHTGPIAPSIKTSIQSASKTAPPIPPPQSTISIGAGPKSIWKTSPSSSRKSMFRGPQFNEDPRIRLSPKPELVSPMTVPGVDHFSLAMGKDTLAVPMNPPRQLTRGETGSSSSNAQLRLSPAISNSSVHTGVSGQSNIREIAPWVDFNDGRGLPFPGNQPPIIGEQIMPQSRTNTEKMDDPDKATTRNPMRGTHDGLSPLGTREEKRMGLTSYLSTGKKDNLKSAMRTLNPVAKLFDGMDEDATDYFGNMVTTLRPRSFHEAPRTPELPHRQRSSSDGAMHVFSSASLRSLITDSPPSLSTMGRRDAICPANDFAYLFPATAAEKVNSVTTLVLPRSEPEDPFVDSPSTRLQMPLPMSLRVGGRISTPVAERNAVGESYEGLVAAQRLRATEVPKGMEELMMMEALKEKEIKVAFSDPFRDSPVSRTSRESDSSVGIAPDVVV